MRSPVGSSGSVFGDNTVICDLEEQALAAKSRDELMLQAARGIAYGIDREAAYLLMRGLSRRQAKAII
jgi:hypothetical protein